MNVCINLHFAQHGVVIDFIEGHVGMYAQLMALDGEDLRALITQEEAK